ncbi:MAG: LysR family transcriptional regulator [Thermoflexaceae bacterium]|nr:LysR family transcriptional regulator [Thermoflexaceae bacterium]
MAELGSVSKAAEKLWMSQPAVSLEIKRLEAELGVLLFDRRANRLVLNDNGWACLRFAHRVDELLETLKREIVGPSNDAAIVTIGSHPDTARNLVMPMLPEFSKESHGTRVVIKNVPTGQVTDRVSSGELDLALFGRHDLAPALVAEPVTTARLWFIARNDHPLAQIRQVSPDELSNFPCVLHEDFTESRDLVRQWSIGHGVALNVAMEFNSQELIVDAVLNGLGIGVASERAIRKYVEDGRLRIICVPGTPLYLTIYAIFMSSASLRAPARLFLDAILSQHASSPTGANVKSRPI